MYSGKVEYNILITSSENPAPEAETETKRQKKEKSEDVLEQASEEGHTEYHR